jgi:hypothetical protein
MAQQPLIATARSEPLMIPWPNFGVLFASSFLFTLFYIKSVGPAALEKKIGHLAYQRCATYRMISSILMIIAALNYILYLWFPLPLPLPRIFSWPWRVSAVIAVRAGVVLPMRCRGTRLTHPLRCCV